MTGWDSTQDNMRQSHELIACACDLLAEAGYTAIAAHLFYPLGLIELELDRDSGQAFERTQSR